MSARTYRLGKRQSDVEATRERIVTAASELLAQPTFYSVTLDDVAKHAGVARATVYYQFESKSGLLRAVITSIIQRGKHARAQRAREHRDAAIGVQLYVREIALFWSAETALHRNLFGLAAIDPDSSRVIDEQFDARRRELLGLLVKRLHDQGRLRSGVTQGHALDVLWMLTSFHSFDQLHGRSGLSARAAAATLSDLAVGAVVEPLPKSTG